MGFSIEVDPTWAWINDSSFGAVRFGVDIARFEVDVDPTRFIGIDLGHFRVLVVVRHFDDESGKYELRPSANCVSVFWGSGIG